MAVAIDRLDHLVLTVRDIDATVAFYSTILGMQPVTSGKGMRALHFGQQKFNLHPAKAPYSPHADKPLPGTADICLVTHNSIDQVVAALAAHGVAVEVGPVPRIGALGRMISVYFRDPANNLVEVSRYADAASPDERSPRG
ncbi:MAG: VOC family protein [Betaproteobacteria bacterium]|nr:VOC family protein [Betaproteobacteria bacterium]